MKKLGCEHEGEVTAAVRSGAWSESLKLHAAECADCGAVMQLAAALMQQAQRAEARVTPPDAHWILERARRQTRERTMRRVARLLSGIRLLASIYVVAVVVWLVRGFAEVQFREVMSTMQGRAGWMAVMGATAAARLVVAGLWPVLRESSRR